MNALEIIDLSKKYSGFTLDNVTLTLPSGCVMGLIGENGAGKSTVIKLILDIVKKDSGTVKILGKDNSKEIELVKEDIGVVLDEVGIPDCLNVKQVGKVMKHTFKNWNECEFSRLIEKFSLPYDKEFKDFSKGMKMKLGIAVAMSHGSKLLILDEATSGLDPVVRDEIIEMFNDFTREEDHSILISSHIVSDLEKLCDYIAFIHRGKVLLCEEKDRLIEKYGMIHCTQDELLSIPQEAVVYKKENPYGVDVMVLKEKIFDDYKVSAVGIEDIFVFTVKGEK